MFSRANLMAVCMLGLGTLLGYQAAWGRLSLAARAGAAEPASPVAEAKAPDAPARAAQLSTVLERAWQTPKPGNPRGATTGPTDAPGYDHPNQFMVVKPTEIAPNMEPVIVHKNQVQEATE